jgi:hypothetical protein
MMEMAGVLRELAPLPYDGVAGMQGLFQLGGWDGLARGDVQILVEQAFMGLPDVDGSPDAKHGSDLLGKDAPAT